MRQSIIPISCKFISVYVCISSLALFHSILPVPRIHISRPWRFFPENKNSITVMLIILPLAFVYIAVIINACSFAVSLIFFYIPQYTCRCMRKKLRLMRRLSKNILSFIFLYIKHKDFSTFMSIQLFAKKQITG